jgi:hypothetical protein
VVKKVKMVLWDPLVIQGDPAFLEEWVSMENQGPSVELESPDHRDIMALRGIKEKLVCVGKLDLGELLAVQARFMIHMQE